MPEEEIYELARKLFGARLILDFGVGGNALHGRCQSFPAMLREGDFYPSRGKICFGEVMICHDERYDLVISPRAAPAIIEKLETNRMIRRDTPDTHVKVWHVRVHPIYIRPTRERPQD